MVGGRTHSLRESLSTWLKIICDSEWENLSSKQLWFLLEKLKRPFWGVMFDICRSTRCARPIHFSYIREVSLPVTMGQIEVLLMNGLGCHFSAFGLMQNQWSDTQSLLSSLSHPQASIITYSARLDAVNAKELMERKRLHACAAMGAYGGV